MKPIVFKTNYVLLYNISPCAPDSGFYIELGSKTYSGYYSIHTSWYNQLKETILLHACYVKQQ